MRNVLKFLSLFALSANLIATAQLAPAKVIWTYGTNGGINVVAAAPDLNRDGKPEVLAAGNDSLSYCLSGGGSEFVREIWSCRAPGAFNDIEYLGDVNGDGYGDVVAGAKDNLVYCISGRPADGGLELWTRADSAYIWSVAALGDVNTDGINDVVVGTANNNMICISGSVQQQGKIIWKFSSDADFFNVIALPDVNGDGKMDCAGSCDNFIYCYSGAITGANAKAIWAAPFDAGARVWSIAAIPDVNGDGKTDILVGSRMDHVDCISGANGSKLWTFTTGADARCVAAISDINGDGKWDVLAGSADDYAYAISGVNGAQIWKAAFASTVLSATALPDVNGDGLADAVFGSDADEIVCISGGGASKGQKIWSYIAGGSIASLAAIADVNGNGIADVAAASTDSYVRLLEGNSVVTEVELVSLTATVRTNGILLAWKTASETSNFGFEIERSLDGNHFYQIGFVPGHGTTAQSHLYEFLDEQVESIELYYRLKQVDCDGQYTYFPILKVARQLPSRLQVYGNYPNPFNAGTFIRYDLPVSGRVEAAIYNLRGELVRMLVDENQAAGSHSVHWNGTLASGEAAASAVYLGVIRSGREVARMQISLVK